MSKREMPCFDQSECINVSCRDCDYATTNHDTDCECPDCWADRNCDANGMTISDAENGY